jgi:hypothetical protein
MELIEIGVTFERERVVTVREPQGSSLILVNFISLYFLSWVVVLFDGLIENFLNVHTLVRNGKFTTDHK